MIVCVMRQFVASMLVKWYELGVNDLIFRLAISLPGFLLAIVFHEAAHAWVAHKFGDDTAKRQGRLSLNPAVHYDMFGTVILPAILLVMGGGVFGYAKPVPVDTRQFKNVKWGIFFVSSAGPAANILLAIISSLLMVISSIYLPQDFYLYSPITQMLQSSVMINLILAVFNLIPFPPLDGSKMLATFLDYNQARKYEQLQNYSFIFFIILWTTNIFSYLMIPALGAANGMIRIFYSMVS